MTAKPSLPELFAILLVRDLRHGDATIMVGANMPMARAAAVLASMTSHPDARVLIGMGVQSLGDASEAPPVHPFLFDPRTLAAEALMWQGRVFDDMSRPDVFFVGGLQVDRRGNLNLFGIPDGNGGWKVRGPGSLALASMSTHCNGYYIVMAKHEPRTFVERVALISALGDVHERARLGFPGGGPRMVLSPLGVFDFDEDGDMRVRSLHAGVKPNDVRDATGFDLHVPDDPPRTEPPSDDELAVLRERVDVHGTLAR
jgi:glutaconate CoA-transferase subunit B